MKNRGVRFRQGRIHSLLGFRVAGFALAAVLLAAVSISFSPLPCRADPPVVNVLVSIVPQAFFVDRIGGKKVSTSVLIPAGRSPHTFETTPTQMILTATADVYFTIGLPFEQNILPKILDISPDMTVVSTQAIEDGLGPEFDPHTWMNPRLALAQAHTICDALVKIDAQGARAYRANMDSLRTDLLELDEELSEILAPCRGGSFFVFHPAFGHFADAYGLEQIAIESEGKEPTARDLAELIESASSREVRVIFVQPQHAARSAETLADEINAAVVALDPLAYDYLGNLREIAMAIEESAR